MTYTRGVFAELAYLFRHALLRDAAYQLQLPRERGDLHALALELLEHTLPSPGDDLALELADHARAADRPELAPRELAWLARAAGHARAGYQYSDALRCFDRMACHATAKADQRRAAALDAAITLGLAGRVHEADARLDALAADQTRLGATLAVELAASRLRRGDAAGAEGLIQAALPDAQGATRAALLRALAETHLARRQPLPAATAYQQALEAAHAANDQPGAAAARHGLAQLLFGAGKLAEAEREFRDIAEQCSRNGNPRGQVAAWSRLGWLLLSTGRKAEAARALEDARRVLARIGDQRAQAALLINLGTVHWGIGELDRAQALFVQAAELAAELGDLPGLGMARSNRGWLLLQQGRHDAALVELAGALELARRCAVPMNLNHALTGLGWWSFATARFTEAEQRWQEALAMAQARQSNDAQLDCRCWLSRLALLQGRVGEAAQQLAQAEALAGPMRASWHGAAVASMRVRLAVVRRGVDPASAELALAATEALAQMRAAFGPGYEGSWELDQLRICEQLVAGQPSLGGHLLTELTPEQQAALV